MAQTEHTIGGVTVRYTIHGDRVIFRTHGGGTKPTSYTYHLTQHVWMGKAPYYLFAAQLLALLG
jgi:hypothetical protein